MNNNPNTNNKIVLDLENKPDSVLLYGDSSVKVNILINKMISAFSTEGYKHLMSLISQIARIPSNGSDWFHKGISCELLQPGENWKKGTVKIKLQLEFIPDEPEPETNKNDSVLDDIRQSIN
ncbi:KGK domain-containing protein [Cyanothece sp. BG0011]|uniref:KGK domain-containing protein n=1 Tax=Cyanothece sp. BG0011 TaxID=2082950 RepID=UPI000D1D686C|nr:KGK domain-containing protein [Cyanothece sp. BG0011]